MAIALVWSVKKANRDKTPAPKQFERAVHLNNFQVLLGDRE